MRNRTCYSLAIPESNMFPIVAFFITTLLVGCFSQTVVDMPEVDLPSYGTLQGKTVRTKYGTSDDTITVEQFLRVPYAKPPLDDLRFMKPQEPDWWTGTRLATEFGPACPQDTTILLQKSIGSDITIDEDCLYLNVYTPKTSRDNLPVMIFFHGGGYIYGAAQEYNGTYLASKGVVVVTANYRLGALGFLSTESESARGNWGMWDQIEVMIWVQENIGFFRGDYTKVTIMGENAGASAVGLHLLSPATKNLFSRVIMQSGSPTASWAYISSKYSARKYAQELGEEFNCPITSSKELVDCLKGISSTQIYRMQSDIDGSPDAGAWAPVIDDEVSNGFPFLPDDPIQLLKRGELKSNIDILSGTNKEEGSSIVFFEEIPGIDQGLEREYFSKLITEIVTVRTESNIEDISSVIQFEYTDWLNTSDKVRIRNEYINMYTDYLFISPEVRSLRVYAEDESCSVYQYSFNYRSAENPIPDWMGVTHGNQLPYALGEPFDLRTLKQNWTDHDREVSEKIMQLWTNFAKYGNPLYVEVEGLEDIEWERFYIDSQAYLSLGYNSRLETNLRPRKVAFWSELVPILLLSEDLAVTESAPNLCKFSRSKLFVLGLIAAYFGSIV